MINMILLIGTILLFFLCDRSSGYGSGAPDGLKVCFLLMPGHDILDQTSPSPYQISASATSYKPGQEITVTVSSNSGATFEGFLIQARKAKYGTGVGDFQTTSDDIKITCTKIGAASATHTNDKIKSSVSAVWKATGDSNYTDIIFQATVLKDFSTFWTGIKTPTITVESSNATSAPTDSTKISSSMSSLSSSTVTSSATAPDIPSDSTKISSSMNSLSSSTVTSSATAPDIPSAIGDVDTSTCVTSKSCLRHPPDCTSACPLVATWKNNVNGIDYELSSTASSTGRWVSIGLSKDQSMGSDTVIDCIHDESSNMITVRTSINSGKSNKPVDDDGKLLLRDSTSGGYEDGRLFCRFTLLKSQQTRRRRQASSDLFSPDTEKYFLLLAAGSAKSGVTEYHGKDKISSTEPFDFTSANFGDVQSGGSGIHRLVKAHAIIMIFAWMVFASFGILLPKYYKSTWSGLKWCGKPIWFQLHQPVMVLTLALTIAGFVIIFIKVGGYSKLSAPTDAHPPIGIIAMILTLANPIMALFRCGPDAPMRPIFNILHSVAGHLAHFAAVVTILLGLYMEQLGLPDWCRWIMVAFICWHLLIEILLKIHDHCPMAGRNWSPAGDTGHFSAESTGKTTAEDNDIYKTIVLLLHVLGVTTLSVAMAVQIGMS